jgi:hypothetical protein
MLLTLVISGCTKVKYQPCPVFEAKTEPPLLNLTGTGKMFKLLIGDYFVLKRKGKPDREIYIQETSWVTTDRTVKRVTTFEKKCYQRDADFISSIKGTNIFNANNEDLEPYFKIPKIW